MARSGHLAIAIADGSALVMGGNSSEAVNVPDSSSTERFDPVAETFSAGPALVLSVLDGGFTLATPLRSGGFLLVGGGINSGIGLGIPSGALTQRFDAVRGVFVRSGDLQRVRSGADVTATLLGDGRVAAIGGGFPARPSSEIYDPATGQWTVAQDLQVARRGHTATLLKDGRVLVAGGAVCCTAGQETFTNVAEIYDPASGSSRLTGSLGQGRGFHRATLLADGRVLLSGGFGGNATDFTALAASEIFDPATGTFSVAGAFQVPRLSHSAILLSDGRVLAVGGTKADRSGVSETELFDPRTGKWTAGPLLAPAWAGVTATLLGNGKVLLFGGEDAAGFPRPDTFLLE
ncbi:MAG: Kelch repeat-containing protein [Myxococcales bacterium]